MNWSTRVATPRTRTEETSAVVVATRETLAKIDISGVVVDLCQGAPVFSLCASGFLGRC